MNFWFTADTHFHHGRILQYCHRPFADTKEMNDTIINNWNSLVKPEDLVYHLGDFCFGNKDFTFDMVFSRLRGSIVFIQGNHDKLAYANRHKFFVYHQAGLYETKVEGISVTLCHYAMRTWSKSHYGAFHLYGHSHGTLPDDPNSRSFDVGVDCNNFTPVSWEQVKERMAKKTFKPIDHHTGRS